MFYPTLDEVSKADREQLARWYRFLPDPKNEEQTGLMSLICERFKEIGFFDEALSKKIGWTNTII